MTRVLTIHNKHSILLLLLFLFLENLGNDKQRECIVQPDTAAKISLIQLDHPSVTCRLFGRAPFLGVCFLTPSGYSLVHIFLPITFAGGTNFLSSKASPDKRSIRKKLIPCKTKWQASVSYPCCHFSDAYGLFGFIIKYFGNVCNGD